MPVESGVWIPILQGGTTPGSPVYTTTRLGSYFRLGNVVRITCSLVISSNGGMSGDLRISGLPFSASTSVTACSAAVTGINLASGRIPTFEVVQNVLKMRSQGNAGSFVVTADEVGDSLSIWNLTAIFTIA